MKVFWGFFAPADNDIVKSHRVYSPTESLVP